MSVILAFARLSKVKVMIQKHKKQREHTEEKRGKYYKGLWAYILHATQESNVAAPAFAQLRPPRRSQFRAFSVCRIYAVRLLERHRFNPYRPSTTVSQWRMAIPMILRSSTPTNPTQGGSFERLFSSNCNKLAKVRRVVSLGRPAAKKLRAAG